MPPADRSDERKTATPESSGSRALNSRQSDSLDAKMASRIIDWVGNDEAIDTETTDPMAADDPTAAGDYWVDDSTERDLSASQEDTHDNLSTVDPMVVYLDGQLNDQQRKELEDQLLVDEKARQHLAELQKSWDALDALPRAQCSQSFTESTVKLVVKDAIKLKTKSNHWQRPLRVALGVALVLLSISIGFIGARRWMTADDRQLLQDMELIENWEKYEAVGDLPFLKRLEKEELFTGELNDVVQ